MILPKEINPTINRTIFPIFIYIGTKKLMIMSFMKTSNESAQAL